MSVSSGTYLEPGKKGNEKRPFISVDISLFSYDLRRHADVPVVIPLQGRA